MKLLTRPYWTREDGMLRFITGPTGAGKSGYMTDRLLWALANTDRWVVTNLAIEWDPWIDGKGVARHGLKWVIEQMYPTVDPEAWKERIFYMPPLGKDKTAWDAIRWFFLYRPVLQEDGTRKLTRCDNLLLSIGNDDKVLFTCDEKTPRCHYLIDEAHEFFGAEDWAHLAKGHRSWASQNRRAGDEADLGTQVPGNVAKPFRKLATECHVLINHAKLTWLFIKQPDKISYRVYATTEWTPTDSVLRAGVLLKAKRYIEGYNSAKGAGVSGAAADLGEKAKGLHWAAVPPLLLCLLLVAGCGAVSFWRWGIDAMQHKTFKMFAKAHDTATNATPAIFRAAPSPTNQTAPHISAASIPARITKFTPTPIQGYMTAKSNQFAVVWEDGSVSLARSVRDSGRYVYVDGEPCRLRAKNNQRKENSSENPQNQQSPLHSPGPPGLDGIQRHGPVDHQLGQ